jgi:arabinogalactan endo-1,4-beta-galactosidase
MVFAKATRCVALEEVTMARPESTGRKIGRIAGKKLLTFDDLVALGHPYTRQHTKRLEDAGVFPQRVKPGGEHSNFVAWIADEYFAYLDGLGAARNKRARAPKALETQDTA